MKNQHRRRSSSTPLAKLPSLSPSLSPSLVAAVYAPPPSLVAAVYSPP
jgi:hypothetical protein